jgi:sortase A
LVFYNLDKLRRGDEVILQDGRGRAYTYSVSESFGAMPYDSWVMGQEVGRDMLTLQTCIPPLYEERLIVRAVRAQPLFWPKKRRGYEAGLRPA